MNESQVRNELAACLQSEAVESLVTVLVGVNVQNPHMKKKLEDFAKNVGVTQFVILEDASEKTLAKLAAFVSKSITSQSQALGSGTVSNQASLTF